MSRSARTRRSLALLGIGVFSAAALAAALRHGPGLPNAVSPRIDGPVQGILAADRFEQPDALVDGPSADREGERVAAAAVPAPESRDRQMPAGSAGRCRLRVEMTVGGRPAEGTLHFVAGPHEGRGPVAIEGGVAEVEGCLAGMSLVRIDVGRSFAVREVNLRRGRSARLGVDFGDHGTIVGRVTDAEGVALPGSTVELGDQRVVADHSGAFRVSRTSSGRDTLIVRSAGHATVSRVLGAGRAGEMESVREFRLPPAAAATIKVVGGAGGSVELVPAASGVARSGLVAGVDGYPWSRLAPLRTDSSGELRLTDLPPGSFRLVGIGEHALGETGSVWLRSGAQLSLELPLTEAPSAHGVVLRDGAPVDGATVSLRPENLAGARRAALADQGRCIDRHPVGPMSGLRQLVMTGPRGEFLVRSPRVGRERLALHATDESGRGRTVQWPRGTIRAGFAVDLAGDQTRSRAVEGQWGPDSSATQGRRREGGRAEGGAFRRRAR